MTEAERSSSSKAIFWVHLLLRSIKYQNIDQNWSYRQQIVGHVVLFLKRISTGHPRLLQVHTGQFYRRPFPFRRILLIAS